MTTAIPILGFVVVQRGRECATAHIERNEHGAYIVSLVRRHPRTGCGIGDPVVIYATAPFDDAGAAAGLAEARRGREEYLEREGWKR